MTDSANTGGAHGVRIPFLKMNGLGNDFVVIDNRVRYRDGVVAPNMLRVNMNADMARSIADRGTGVGCDQLVLLEPSENASIFMRIFNADGNEVDACGNASRCIGWLMQAEVGGPASTIETNAGVIGAAVQPSGQVTVDMGTPRFDWDEIPLSEEFHDTSCIELQIGPIDAPVLHSPCVVNVGNPHAIFWVDDLDAHDLETVGPFLENHILFPERANITLARVDSRSEITVRVWERGTGITKACGTAACATAVCAARRDLTDRQAAVNLPGGTLGIEWREADNHILMTGDVALDFGGELDLADYGFSGA